MSLSHGREHLAIPGPSVAPDRVLRAMHRASPNIYEGELIALTDSVLADLRRVAGAEGAEPAIYLGNGHAAWEAAVVNVLAPGERALALATGRFGPGWAEVARRAGVDVELLDFGFRAAADPQRLEDRLRADRAGAIRAVMTVQTDTASAARNDVPALRAAIDAAGHPALLMVDCIASLGSEEFRMDAWGVDVTVGACQKGLMTPAGVAFTWAGPRAMAERVDARSAYWDWGPRLHPEIFYQRFAGTPPSQHIYGLREALTMILDEEGIEAVWARHAALAGAVWAAVEAWGARDAALALNIADPAARSHAVTTIRTAPEVAARLRRWSAAKTGLTLGVGLAGGPAAQHDLFRIGHMGHLNAPMLLGALGVIEAGLTALGVPHGAGALDAAARAVAEATSAAPPRETIALESLPSVG